MILAWDNKADGAVLTTDSEIATLPASNVQTEHIAQKWHTQAGVKAAYLLFDMLTPVTIGLMSLLGTNFTAAATVRVRGSTVDPTGVAGDAHDSGVVNAGVKAGYGASYKSVTNNVARYWRIDPADATVPDNLQVGRVFLGPKFTPATNQNYGWGIAPIDPSKIGESYGGQWFGDARPQRRQVQFVLDWLTEAEAFNNIFAMARAAGIVRDVLAIHDIAGTYLSEQAVFGLMNALEPIFNRHTLTWAQKITVRERL